MNIEVGEYLKAKRKSRGITGEFIANELKITRQTLTNKEKNKSPIDVEEFVHYCRLVGLEPAEALADIFLT